VYRSKERRQRLNDIAFDIELLLISVVQGLAITTIAENSIHLINGEEFIYWPYILAAFLFVIIYWAQVITHTLSFIDWPVDIVHTFLYYLIALVEFVAFSTFDDPKRWFFVNSILMIFVTILYLYDYRLIKRKPAPKNSPAKKKLLQDTLEKQIFGLRTFVPGALIFNLAALFLIHYYPQYFIGQNYHLILISIQIILALVYLLESLKDFRIRIGLITKSV